ncbi:pentapeptide repeat-containing protein [Streptomyces paradoxus]|uniref:pentapeptide repeat-containing protein n=1 Tax=Streptomyces paradoxus TaxID=66375 RepID=UPI0037D16272
MGPGRIQATSRSLFGAAAVTQRARFTEVVPEPELVNRTNAPAPNKRHKPLWPACQRQQATAARVTLFLGGHVAEHNAVPRPTEPVQAALTVLGRRPRDRDESFGVHLGPPNLRRVLLIGAHLEGANLTTAHLEGASLSRPT